MFSGALRTPFAAGAGERGQPTGAHVMVHNGQDVFPGDILAKIPRATTKTKDITGGLPRASA